jgi:hypothetical protein
LNSIAFSKSSSSGRPAAMGSSLVLKECSPMNAAAAIGMNPNSWDKSGQLQKGILVVAIAIDYDNKGFCIISPETLESFDCIQWQSSNVHRSPYHHKFIREVSERVREFVRQCQADALDGLNACAFSN